MFTNTNIQYNVVTAVGKRQ